MTIRLPAEHGAWGILLVPLVTSATVAGRDAASWAPAALVLLCAIGFFILRGSLAAHGTWGPLASPEHLALLVVSAGAGTALVLAYHRHALVALGLAAALLFALHHWLVRWHEALGSEKRSLLAELVGVALLSIGAPAAWVATRGSLDAEGVRLWLLNLLFFAGGVLYVKYRVRGVLAHRSFVRWQDRCAFAWPVFAYHLLLGLFLAAWVWMDSLPAAVFIAFAPAVLRAHGLLLQLGARFPIKRLGWTEVAHALFFAAILILTFHS